MAIPIQGMPEIVKVPAVFMFTKYPCPAVSLVSELNAAGCPLYQNADADLISCTSCPQILWQLMNLMGEHYRK